MKDEKIALLVPLPAACQALGVSRPTLYRLLASGQLKARKSGRRTLIEGESMRTYAANLPAFTPKSAA